MNLTELYYRLRRRMGMEEIAANRIREHRLLHPEEDAEAELLAEDRKRLKQLVLCLAVTVILTGGVLFRKGEHTYTVLMRPGYGEDAREEQLDLSVEEREYRIPVVVDSRSYGTEELEELFDKAWELVSASALGENPDWMQVSLPLSLTEETGVPGIRAIWNSSNVDLVSMDGSVWEPVDEEDTLTLTAILRFEQEEREYSREIRVVPPNLSAEQREERQLKEALESALKDREAQEVRLPGTLNGRPVTYTRKTEDLPLWLIPVLGLAAMAALWMLPEQRRREALLMRERELAMSYSELVWKLTVLLGAGMTVKAAWGRILAGYREKRAGGGPEEVLYEEMQMTFNAMSQGTYEEKAYAAFGRRCGLPPYLRLGSLLETNVRQGRKGMAELMQSEAEAAFRERLQLARRQGEEASSRLLMPMMLLFGLVLVILMVPALSQFT